MKAESVIKIVLDIFMIVLFAVLLFAYNTGLVFHEIMGLYILLMFGIHLVLNRRWIISVSKKLMKYRLKGKTLWMCILNIGLLIGVIGITVTGLMISTVVIPRQNSYNPSLIFMHKWLAYITAGGMAVHLVLHGKYMISSVKKIFVSISGSLVKRTVSGIFVLVLIGGIVYYNVIPKAIKNDISSLANVTDTTSDTPADNYETTVPAIIKRDDEDEEDEQTEMTTPSETHPAVITLSEFLSKMFCTICPKHCALSSPRCGKSSSLITEAKAEYASLYDAE